MDKLRGKNVTFFMEDELDECSINLTTWNAVNGLFCETADELAKVFKRFRRE
jgi:hypothetical protein